MKISGSIPTHIARAYGVPQSAAPTRVPAAAPAAPTERARSVDARAAEPTSAKLRELIGGNVQGSIDFSSGVPSAGGSFLLYTRAADTIEAAVGVQLGRAIDVKG